MLDKTNTSTRDSIYLRILCHLRIRQLLLVVLGLMSLISISAIGWNAIQVYHQYNDAEHLSYSHEISQQALTLNTHLARERGLTAALLAGPSLNNDQNTEHLYQLRSRTDDGLQLLQNKLDQRPIFYKRANIRLLLKNLNQRLINSRQYADDFMQNNNTEITYTDWISALTQCIADVATISRIVMAPLKDEEDVIRYGMFFKEFFFTLSENAGKERALISAVIAQQRPFHQDEYQLLDTYQYTSALDIARLSEVLAFLPHSPSIVQAQQELKQSFQQDYQLLRNSVLSQSRSAQPYAINAIEWFDQSTRAVNSILNLSHAVNQHLNDDIEIYKARSRNTVWALAVTLILVVTVFIIAFMAIYRRILLPLRELELSANTIATGDFSHSTEVLAEDEFGELAEAFEVMRNYLLIDRELREKAENELRKLSTAIEQSVSSIVITDKNGITEYVNPQFHLTTGYTVEEVVGRKFNILNSGKTPKSLYSDLWKTINDGRVWQGEMQNRKKNGTLFWELVSISPVRDKSGNTTHFISVQHDITHRKEMEQQLNFMAYHDELTGLPNRALFSDRYEQLAHLAKRDDKKIALMMMDLDRFKFINDSLGHRVGDQLLVEIAERLKKMARVSDTIARYGGDEFVILASGFSNIEALIDIARRLVEVVEETVTIDGHILHISTSVGVSIWPDDGQDIDTLLRKADTAMYHAKELGGGGFQFFTDELNQKTMRRLQLENALHDAIQNDEFELYYQPQINLASGRIVGAEALIRWNHPEMGLVSPADFIPLAEETNLIQSIGDWVLKTACAQAAYWKRYVNPELMMAVNVSALQLDDPKFIDRLTTIVNQSTLPFESLEIEITESSVMHKPDKMSAVLDAIIFLGIKLALDDFGTGYSSLSYLRRFPFDKLKIDQSFIRDMSVDQENTAIIRTMIDMGHNLNMNVIAEGVETARQMEYLKSNSCDEIQGYLISRPVPANEFEKLLMKSEPFVVAVN